jgi:hypothetical protein
MAARKPRLLRIPASVRMAGYTIPVFHVANLMDEGEGCDGLFLTESSAWGPMILIRAELQGTPAEGDTFMHELVEGAAHFAGIDYDGKKFARFTHDSLTTQARFLWEALTSAYYPRRK